MKKKAIIQLSIISGFLAFLGVCIAWFFNSFFFQAKPYLFLYLIPIIAAVINFLSFYSVTGKVSTNLSTLITSLFGIKFFAYTILAVIFFLIEKDKQPRFFFIFFLFIIYISFTFVLLRQTLKYLRSIDRTN